MDNSTYEPESDKQHPQGSFIGLQIDDRIINWLADFLQLKEEEQKDAGICLGDKHNN